MPLYFCNLYLFTQPNCTFLDNNIAMSLDGNGTIRDSWFEGNGPSDTVRIYDGLATITDTVFLRNYNNAVNAHWAALTIDRCAFLEHQGWAVAGSFVNAAIRNSLFTGTVVRGAGGTIDLSHALLTVDNCTFYANAHDDISPAGINMYMPDSHAVVRNSVVWGVPGDPYNIDTVLLRPQSEATMEVHYSLVEGWTGALGGAGNSGADPMFADPIGPDGIPGTEDDDLQLSPGSPAINAGDPNTAGLPSTDLDGHARVLCGRVDIGAYPKFVSWEESWAFFAWESLVAGRHEGSAWTIGV